MNKKKLNIIDIGVILIIILFAVGLGIRLLSSTSKSLNETTSLEYTVIVENVREYTVEALGKSSTLTDYKGADALGEIVSFEYAPYVAETTSEDGNLITAEMPEKFKCTLVIRSDAKALSDRYYLTDEIEVAPGKNFGIYTKYTQTTGTIISVNEATENVQ